MCLFLSSGNETPASSSGLLLLFLGEAANMLLFAALGACVVYNWGGTFCAISSPTVSSCICRLKSQNAQQYSSLTIFDRRLIFVRFPGPRQNDKSSELPFDYCGILVVLCFFFLLA